MQMPILKSKILAFEETNLVAIDKHLEFIESTLNFGATLTVADYVIDHERNVLWLLTTDSKIRKITFIQDASYVTNLQLVATITVNFYNETNIINYSKFLALDKNTGNLYYMHIASNSSYGATLYKINYDVTGSVSATTNGVSVTLSNYSYATGGHLLFILNDIIYIFPSNYSSTSESMYWCRFNAMLNLDLTTIKYGPYCVRGNQYYQALAYPKKNGLNSFSYNPFINGYLGQAVTNLEYQIQCLNPSPSSIIVPSSSYYNSIFSSLKTGNIYTFSSDNKTCKVYSPSSFFPLLYTIDFPNSVTDYNKHVAVNLFSEEIYRIVGGVINMYDRFGNPLKTSLSLNKNFTLLICVHGADEVAPYPTTPSKIVYPVSPNIISSSTPTFVFKVGINPTGWTQQFRVCLDKIYSELSNNDETYAYDRVFDSWANGSNYDPNVTFYYSTDYDPSSNNPETGTWQVLGTGDGLQQNGVVPTNGVSCPAGSVVYVKFTVPQSKELDGLETGQQWYIKIYSFSKK